MAHMVPCWVALLLLTTMQATPGHSATAPLNFTALLSGSILFYEVCADYVNCQPWEQGQAITSTPAVQHSVVERGGRRSLHCWCVAMDRLRRVECWLATVCLGEGALVYAMVLPTGWTWLAGETSSAARASKTSPHSLSLSLSLGAVEGEVCACRCSG